MDIDDFKFNSPLASLNRGELRTFVWRTYSRYRHKGYSSADEAAEVVKEYEPLLDTPDLFLEFAALGSPSAFSRDELPMAVVLWIRTYGLLGLTPADESYRVPGSNKRIPQQAFEEGALHLGTSNLKWFLVEEYSDRGGPEESVITLLKEATLAYRTLSLYKAALEKDVEELEELMDLEGTIQRIPSSRDLFGEYFSNRSSESRPTFLINMATAQIEMNVQRVLSKFAYPCLSVDLSNARPKDEKLRSPQSLTASLWPRNLLGAMYLQFYWMVDSASQLSQCKHCQKPISYAPTMPGSGKRKTYKNKRFCSKQCRQNYYYHHHRKPGRQDP